MDTIKTEEKTKARSKITDEIVVAYTYDSENQKPVGRVSATILKNDEIVGYFNTDATGLSGLTINANNGLSVDEKQQISARIYADEQELFTADEPITEE